MKGFKATNAKNAGDPYNIKQIILDNNDVSCRKYIYYAIVQKVYGYL